MAGSREERVRARPLRAADTLELGAPPDDGVHERVAVLRPGYRAAQYELLEAASGRGERCAPLAVRRKYLVQGVQL